MRVTALRLERVETPVQRLVGIILGAAILVFGSALLGWIASGIDPARPGSRSEIRGYLFVIVGVCLVLSGLVVFLRDMCWLPAAVCCVTRQRVVFAVVGVQKPVAILSRARTVEISSERHARDASGVMQGRRAKVWHTWRIGDGHSEVRWTMGEPMRGSQQRKWRERLAGVGVTTKGAGS